MKGLCSEPMGTGKATISILRGLTIHKNFDMRYDDMSLWYVKYV